MPFYLGLFATPINTFAKTLSPIELKWSLLPLNSFLFNVHIDALFRRKKKIHQHI